MSWRGEYFRAARCTRESAIFGRERETTNTRRARFSQGRSSFSKSRGESFRSCAQGLANAKPFHRRDYGTSIFSACDPVAITPRGKVKKKRRGGERYPDGTKYEGLIRLANRNVLLYWDGTTLFEVFVK